MTIARVKAKFYRGGSSNAVFFHDKDLPGDCNRRDALFLHVIGSPDPYQRQLNGLGGGVSSLSKVVIVSPSSRPDVDIDYTFAQVAVDRPVVDYGSMCGNMSASVGPFAVDEGLVDVGDGDVTVRIFNTNTSKIFHAHFSVKDGVAIEAGDFVIPGVAGSGAKVVLNYQDPGGAATGKLLPSGQTADRIKVTGIGDIKVSLVDASNPVVFVNASDIGLTASERPDALESNPVLMQQLDEIRRLGGVLMKIARQPADVGLSNPKVAIVGLPSEFTAIDETSYTDNDHDLAIRIVSMERIHRAVTLTGALCTATAAQIPGTVVHTLSHKLDARLNGEVQLRLGNPSGVIPVAATVHCTPQGEFHAVSATSYRTQRCLMEGFVRVPQELIS